MIKVLLTLAILSIFASCNNDKDEKMTNSSTQVKQIPSPAGDSCAEPFLFTDKNEVIYLSWIEKKGNKAHFTFLLYPMINGRNLNKLLRVTTGL